MSKHVVHMLTTGLECLERQIAFPWTHSGTLCEDLCSDFPSKSDKQYEKQFAVLFVRFELQTTGCDDSLNDQLCSGLTSFLYLK
jgi:hypothetical protein